LQQNHRRTLLQQHARFVSFLLSIHHPNQWLARSLPSSLLSPFSLSLADLLPSFLPSLLGSTYTTAPYPLPAIYLDLIAHLNPRIKEIEQRTKHAEVAFKPFDQVDLAGKPAPALAERLRKLLVETPNSEWYSVSGMVLSLREEEGGDEEDDATR